MNITCTEPFEFEPEDFENILVVEGNITDEFSTKEITLSRTFDSDETQRPENGAQVTVEDDIGNVFNFQEQGTTGKYLSQIDFEPLPDRTYILRITTSSGNSYSSAAVSLPPKAEIQDLKAVKTTQDGVEGVSILVSSQGVDGMSGFYRYTYEETYRIVSFFNPTKELVVVSEDPPELELVDKTREERICYKTVASNAVFTANSDSFGANSVDNFQLRFIERLDRIVTSRYSILVRQFSQSREANTFYENLKEFSSLENLFSQTQPGFITGNVSSDDNPNEKVLGFFETTRVSSRRIFFSFSDIFGNGVRFLPDCEIIEPSPTGIDLFRVIKNGTFKYVSETVGGAPLVAPTACSDCTVLGSNIVPLFWED
ncbi:DUF4249 domain-containing protein [Costertonia aggregata]|uniref:DUF4249 domain-containing protein n=1 Tax=Costertonia aggregata TaxID=343403 RepID=A0A7H9AU33_9FLAO|nr:DUF4249 domain-containing protein [Costertonia aggregata]QLG46822.1 DUF4249 domain-containing protein [Costertonia aggregata]